MWLGMYSYVHEYYADNSHNLSIQSLYTLCTFNYSHGLDWLDQSYLYILWYFQERFSHFPGIVMYDCT